MSRFRRGCYFPSSDAAHRKWKSSCPNWSPWWKDHICGLRASSAVLPASSVSFPGVLVLDVPALPVELVRRCTSVGERYVPVFQDLSLCSRVFSILLDGFGTKPIQRGKINYYIQKKICLKVMFSILILILYIAPNSTLKRGIFPSPPKPC